ncbi:hypothetical protein DL766_007516 [Monosporascus sp. MC13-8B]|uniref:Ketoreductase (KR) domain-containing protein n=1 Tax=Monosporascus cannonballus TaxID=155416 RepID=A0ABY0HET4_9PEZI|nr:hypothetical protein DL762_002434 [Monosporascus cannonballus]RYP00183.1 hypothetical protein DL763_000952 [Monosporascus cannonballus]RYP23448.1 hypothetical protein DL766_007516 [Monosporascus sp. MC13-8B]
MLKRQKPIALLFQSQDLSLSRSRLTKSEISAASLKACPAAEDLSVNLIKVESMVDTDAEAAVEAEQAQEIDQLDIVIANADISNVFARVEDIDLRDPREMSEVNTGGPVSLFRVTYPLVKKMNLKDKPPFLLGSYGASKVALNYGVRRCQLETEWLTSFVCDPGFIETDMGNPGAKFFGMGRAVVPVKVSVSGILKRIDEATREKDSGRLLLYNGTEISYYRLAFIGLEKSEHYY